VKQGEACILVHQSERQPCQLGGEQPPHPAPQRMVMACLMHQHGGRADNEPLAQIAVAHLGDPPQPDLAAT
jgi:hypothetical protein